MLNAPFDSWFEAFEALNSAINLFGGSQKIVLFLDETPWLATAKSGFLQALNFHWNCFWSEDARIKLIICRSTASPHFILIGLYHLGLVPGFCKDSFLNSLLIPKSPIKNKASRLAAWPWCWNKVAR